MKKVAFFYTPPIEIIEDYTRIFSELIEHHILKNDQIIIVNCKGSSGLNKCIANYRGDRSKCYKCKTGLTYILKKYSIQNNIEFLSYSDEYISTKRFCFQNYEDLRRIDYGGINIGNAAHSCAITTFRDHKYNINKRKNFIIESLKNSVKTINVLEKIKPNHVYSFNGRVSYYNTIVKYAEFSKIEYSIFEISANKNNYIKIDNQPLHSVKSYTSQIEYVWERSKIPLKEKKIQAEDFFNLNSGRAKNSDYQITIFSKDKATKNKKFEKIKTSGKKIISIFNASRNEFECVEGWNDQVFYDDDENLIDRICKYFVKNKELLFVLRVHPNLKFLKNTQNKNIKKLNSNKNLLIIYPNEEISSYELMRLSETIITFGSTIGVEATYMGKKSISIGDSLYKELNCTYNPKSFRELINQIQNKNFKNKPKKSTFKYGFYILNNGNNFRLSKKEILKYSILKFICLKILNLYKYLTYSNLRETYSNLKRNLI